MSEKDNSIAISVREANELRFVMSKEFVTARAEHYHRMIMRIDRILTEMGVEPIKNKFELETITDTEN